MNRIEFMTELAALLQEVPEEERKDAMQYYNDYFDDAGEEKEQEVIRELESPEKVAEKIRADFKGQQREGWYTENGYEDPASSGYRAPAQKTGAQGYQYQAAGSAEKPRTSNTLKIILIIAIVLIGGPIIIPCAIAVAAVIFACIAGILALAVGIVVMFAALAVVGAVLVCVGIVTLIPEIAVGLALLGTGLILGVIGVIGTVVSVRLCVIAIPGIVRGIVWVCRKPFHKKAEV